MADLVVDNKKENIKEPDGAIVGQPGSSAVNSEQKTDITNYEPPLGMECHRIKTKAERTFDAAAYSGIGWFGNAALSTSIAYYLKHSKSGKPKFDHFVRKVAEFLNKENPPIAAVNKNAEFFSLIIGGTMLMYPLKKLEDHKGKVIRGIDRIFTKAKAAFGRDETEIERIDKEASFELLDQEPKQSWATILRARFVGLGVALLILNLVGSKNNNAIEDATSRLTSNLLKKHVNPELTHKVTKLATLDVLYSAVAAAGLYIDSHLINPPKEGHKLQEGGLNPLNPPNAEPSWVSHAKPKATTVEKKFPAPPSESFAQRVVSDTKKQSQAQVSL